MSGAMENTGSETLQRKLDAGRNGAPPGGRSALRALRLGLARAGRDTFDLSVAVIGAKQNRIAQETAGEHLSDDHLLVLLDGPNGEVGALSLDRSCLAALVQQQTMGRVNGADPDQRRFTSTDAAMAAPLIDAMIDRAAGLAEQTRDQHCLSGFRFGARARDVRSVVLALEADRMRLFTLTADFSAGVRQGQIKLLLPDTPVGDATDKEGGDNHGLARAVAGARASLSVVVDRLHLALADLSALQAGDTVPLPGIRLNHADLVAINGETVGVVRLGQSGGFRAIRFNETVAPAPAEQTPGGASFEPGALPQPQPQPHSQPQSQSLVQGIAPEADTNMPGLIDAAVTWLDEGDDPEGGQSPLAGPDASDDDAPLPRMSPEDAAAEISELAGLPLDDEQVPAPVGADA